MKDQQLTWAQDPKAAWEWAMGWVDEAKTGKHMPVSMIRKAAESYKERFCTNGLWAPESEMAWMMLREAQDMAQAEYEDAQSP